MQAVVIPRFGGPEVLELGDVPRPEPEPEQVLVRVHATALNRADLLQREGRYAAPRGAAQEIPGMEFAGEVVAVGRRATLWQVGARVFGIVAAGAHAEYVVAHERAVAEVPAVLGWAEAAAVPEAFITSHDALVSQAGLRSGERVLVHAVGSGVGLAAIQLIRALGATPYGTARGEWKLERAREYGLEAGFAPPLDLAGLGERVAEWTGGRGMDVVLDLVGGPYVEASAHALALKGRLMLVGSVGGADVRLPLGRVMTQRVTIRGTVLRARPIEERILVTRAFAAEVVPLIARGVLRPVVDSRFALADIVSAHRRLGSNETFGKVVLEVAPPSI
jgi:NADPH:quinone reductase